MRKRWIAMLLLIVATISLIAGWNGRIQMPPRTASADSTQAIALHLDPAAMTVQPDRLLADVAALSFTRSDEAGRSRARDYLLKSLQEAGWTPQLQPFESDVTSGGNGVNIVAERPGTDPTAGKILLAAHYDTVMRSPGADDNASGAAVVLEAARLLSNLPTPRALQLVWFDLEETGLIGSQSFASSDRERANLKGAVVMDMVGYGCDTPGCQSYPSVLPMQPPTDRGNFLAVIGDQGHLPLIDAFHQATGAALPMVLSLPIPLLGPLTPDLQRSDHVPFWDKGIGAVLVTDTANFRNPNYHQPTDTPESLNSTFFTGAAQVVVNAIAHLLNTSGELTTQAGTAPRS